MALDQSTFNGYMKLYLANNDVDIAGDLDVTGNLTVNGTLTAGTINNPEMTQLRNNNASLTHENQSLLSENDTLTAANQSLTTANNNLTIENVTLTGQNTTLTEQNQTLTTRVAELEAASSNVPSGPWGPIRYDQSKGLILSEINNLASLSFTTSLAYCFRGLTLQGSLDVSVLNTSNVTNMREMFASFDINGGGQLTGLDSLNVASVTNMKGMFKSCTPTVSGISNWNVSNVTNMTEMFNGAYLETNMDLSNWDVSNVTAICSDGYMFGGVNGTNLKLSGWNLAKASIIYYMFQNSKLATIDLSNWQFPLATSLLGFFQGSTNLTSVDLTGWDTSNITTFTNMFCNCSKLTSIGDYVFDMTSATDIQSMFRDCYALANAGVTLKFKNVSASKWIDESSFKANSNHNNNVNGINYSGPIQILNWID